MTSSARSGHDRGRPAEKEELFMVASFDLLQKLSIFRPIALAFESPSVSIRAFFDISHGQFTFASK
jgi:hypothetical protein